MNKNLKRFITILMTVVMVVGSSMMVFADDTTNITEPNAQGLYGQDITAEGAYTSPSINVTVPTTARFYLNPAKVEISVNGATKDDEIVSVPGKISNSSNVALKMTVGFQIRVQGLELVGTDPAATETEKKAHITFGMGATDTAIGSAGTPKSKRVLSDDMEAATYVVDKTNGEAYFGFDGKCTAEPEQAWKTTDKVTATLKFTFAPTATTATAYNV